MFVVFVLMLYMFGQSIHQHHPSIPVFLSMQMLLDWLSELVLLNLTNQLLDILHGLYGWQEMIG